MLAEELDAKWCFAYNPEVIFDQNSAYYMNEFMPCAVSDSSSLLLSGKQAMTPKQHEEITRRKLITPLLEWQLNRQVEIGLQ